MPTYSLITLRQEFAERLYGTEDILTGTATGGSTTTVVDTALISSMLGTSNYIGAWIRIYDAANAVPEDEVRKVSAFDGATGTLTSDPVWSAAVASTDKYEIHYALHPDRLEEALSRACEVGSKRALAAIDFSSDPDGNGTAYNKDILYEGALMYVKRGLARRVSGPNREGLRNQANDHEANWHRGLILLGYRHPSEDDMSEAPTIAGRARRV